LNTVTIDDINAEITTDNIEIDSCSGVVGLSTVTVIGPKVDIVVAADLRSCQSFNAEGWLVRGARDSLPDLLLNSRATGRFSLYRED